MININKCTDQEMVQLIAEWMMKHSNKEGLEIYKEDGQTNAKVINTFLVSQNASMTLMKFVKALKYDHA